MLGCGDANCSFSGIRRNSPLSLAEVEQRGAGCWKTEQKDICWRDKFGIAFLGVDQKLDKAVSPSGPDFSLRQSLPFGLNFCFQTRGLHWPDLSQVANTSLPRQCILWLPPPQNQKSISRFPIPQFRLGKLVAACSRHWKMSFSLALALCSCSLGFCVPIIILCGPSGGGVGAPWLSEWAVPTSTVSLGPASP